MIMLPPGLWAMESSSSWECNTSSSPVAGGSSSAPSAPNPPRRITLVHHTPGLDRRPKSLGAAIVDGTSAPLGGQPGRSAKVP